MYKYLLESIDGIHWFGTFALVLFFLVFCAAIWRSFSKNPEELRRMAALPLED